MLGEAIFLVLIKNQAPGLLIDKFLRGMIKNNRPHIRDRSFLDFTSLSIKELILSLNLSY